jgi:molybdate-binding protein
MPMMDPASVAGPEAGSHLEVAMTVASGQADAGLGVRAAATALDLGFVPVTGKTSISCSAPPPCPPPNR